MDAFSSRANLPAPNNQRPGHAEFRGPGLVVGTLVTTPDGDKKIEEVVAGDLVLSGVGEGNLRFYRVEQAIAKPYKGPILRIEVETDADYFEHFYVTPSHILFSNFPEDQPNNDSIIFMAFDTFEKHAEIPIHVVSKGVIDEVNLEFDFDRAEEIAENLSASDGGLEIERFAGFGPKNQPTNPWSYRFMTAQYLKIKMNLPFNWYQNIIDGLIYSIDEEHYNGPIYNLNIPQSRNFAANGILVHDSST